jgi:predicted RNase H-like nuclease (RuvC/YqgF family)
MPEQNAQGIDVSKEEERYLRRAFRRFALPYVIALVALSWIIATAVARDGVVPSGAPADLASASEKLSQIEQSLAALDARVAKIGSDVERAGKRMGALESAKPNSVATAGDTASLERSLRDATRRMADLEKRVGDGPTAEERIDALTTRLHRIESAARTAPMPAPGAPAPAPVPAAPEPAL